VGGAGPAGERLVIAQGAERGEDGGFVERGVGRHLRQRPGDGFEVLDPAQPATRFRHPRTHPLGQLLDAEAGEAGAHDPSEICLGDGDVGDVGGGFREAFRQREATGEVLEVGRRGHHHRVAEAVEFERDGGFGHPLTGDGAAGAV
jgi:hypothetical protein